MPLKNKDAYNDYLKRYMRKYRSENYLSCDEWKAKEKKRKAKWYAENKEKKAEAQRKYRAEKKRIENLAKGIGKMFDENHE